MNRKQISKFEATQLHHNRCIVNVASIPQLSPFRYPGGKTWLVPEIRKWLSGKKTRPSELIEPFAGGGIISLTVANERLADHVTMIELDPDVAAVWHTIFSDNSEWLAETILGFKLTVENVQATLALKTKSVQEHAFQTILRNRTNHGGILAPGSGVLKHGENGKGISSRWYPNTLAKRIRELFSLRDRITFIEGDGVIYLEKTLCCRDVAYFIDPPYTAPGKRAGRRLYRYSEIDHDNLFSLCRRATGDFMMTYDDSESVRHMATQHGFLVDSVPMKNTHHKEMLELLIFRDFSRQEYLAKSEHQAA
ncbi:MAG: DNA adenine methylase [Magnetococcales bacterium]|nr:DNA adenine methylase [Magnetococcales bacterium]NGZ26313.1 DNA adenine methylase [Magnetococcales bacterium]